ncbi:hypothetical protein [Nocardia neocaledoniensis]|uniref:hypothetical protein n=1 Tax=Nocardia neocaledoniensis TaxID=236511 RepID=UPI0024553152|nr:hypothetical protein [Nocardia neocaledoniensis]
MPNAIETRSSTVTTNRPRGILAACIARRHPAVPLRGRSPRPDEPDIRVLVQFTAVRMEFAACRTAALAFVQDIAAKRPCSVAVDSRPCRGLPRLPNERLYLLP